MPHKIKINPETAYQAASGVLVPPNQFQFNPLGLPTGSGYVGGKVDLGAAPRTSRFRWQGIAATSGNASVGTYVDIFAATMDDIDYGGVDGVTPYPSGNFTFVWDNSFAFQSNLQYVGRLVVDGPASSGDYMISSGMVEITERYFFPIWYNATGQTLENYYNLYFIPVPDEVQ